MCRSYLTFFILALRTVVAKVEALPGNFDLQFADAARQDRFVGVRICTPDADWRSGNLDLFIFAHGGGLFAEDYGYLCNPLPIVPQRRAVIARLVSSSEDPNDLTMMADDLVFLIQRLSQQQHNASSPLHNRLSGSVVLAGHSMGAAAAIITGSVFDDATVPLSIFAVAPGFWGEQQTSLLSQYACSVGCKSNLSSLTIMVGDQDCANSLVAQQLPLWKNLTTCTPPHVQKTPRLTLAVIPGASHCKTAEPTKGTCNFDKVCSGAQSLSPSAQQAEILLLMRSQPSASLTFHRLDMLNASYVTKDNASAAGRLPTLCPCNGGSAVLV